MVSENEALRLRRLVFYANDIEKFNQALLAFVRKSNAQAVLLVDKDGHLVARQGFKQSGHDGSSLAALVAGSFASTQQVAKILGEPEFRTLSHQGQTQSINVILVGDRTLQIAVFSSQIKPGMIQVMCAELAKQIEAILVEAGKRIPLDEGAQPLGKEFNQEMKNQLDSLFGNL